MKILIQYPVVVLAMQELKITPHEATQIKQMTPGEQARWAYDQINALSLSFWEYPESEKMMEEYFVSSFGKILFREEETSDD